MNPSSRPVGTITKLPSESFYPDGKSVILFYWHGPDVLAITDLGETIRWLWSRGISGDQERAILAALADQGILMARYALQRHLDSTEGVEDEARAMAGIIEGVLRAHLP